MEKEGLCGLEQILKEADCPLLDLSLRTTATTSNAELLKVLLRSSRVEALSLENTFMDVGIGSELLPSFETAANGAHLFKLRFQSPSPSFCNGSGAMNAARFVSELIARDQQIHHLALNESGLDLNCRALVECGLLQSLKNTRSLCYLALRGVGLDAKGAVLLARILETQPTILLLDISGNSVGEAGILAVAECVKKNTTLRFLALCACDATETAGCALAKALEVNTTVDLLCMRDDDLGAASGRAFAEMLKTNTTLHRLHLDYCDLKPEGCGAFVDALSKNQTLKHLTLNHSGIAFHDKIELIRVAKEQKALEILRLEDRNELTIPIRSPSRYTLGTDYDYMYSYDTCYARHAAKLSRQIPQEPPVNLT